MKSISSVEGLIKETKSAYAKWQTSTFPWFRGEPDCTKPLVPKLYRENENGIEHIENRLLQHFRMKAPSLGGGLTPDRGNIDQWLFLAQHVGLPTRLLDWTEGVLVALHFALMEEKPVVWMLDPVELNRRSNSSEIKDNVFPLTWLKGKRGKPNIGHENIRSAWNLGKGGLELPVAVHPTNIHPRMSAQRSCFTVQGRKKTSLSELLDERVLVKFDLNPKSIAAMKKELRLAGITHSLLFPDLDGLAKDLASVF